MRLLLVLFLLPCAALAQELERSPYLQVATTDSMVVAWKTWTDTPGEVRWGPSATALDRSASSPTGQRHAAQLTGLEPDTRYFYAVYSGDTLLAGGADHWFRTAPAVGSRAPVRMWVVGDSGVSTLAQFRVRDAMLDLVRGTPADLFLHVGDMAYTDGTEDEFTANFYGPYAEILRNVPIWPALGNHEGHTSVSATESGPYYDGYVLPRAGEAGGLASGTEAYYAFDYANAHFVVLDSFDSSRLPDGAMLTWLREDLAATDQEWIIAFWHHPPYSKGSHDSDTEGELTEMREHALPILEDAGVDLVLGGHSHVYERSYLLDGSYETPSTDAGIVDDSDGSPQGDGPYRKAPDLAAHDGAVYIVAGHGGSPVDASGHHPVMHTVEAANGSLIVDLQANTLHVRNLRQDGRITDEVAIIKGDALLLQEPNGERDLRPGDAVDIRWQTFGDVPAVDLSLACDDGTRQPLAEDLTNSGSFAWTVPGLSSPRARVRVADAADPDRFDESSAPFAIGDLVPVVLSDFGSTWRWHTGSDPGDAWLDRGFDDSGWASGPGQLGYGDGDETTELPDSPLSPTTYFRRTVRLDTPTAGGELSAIFDDGVAVWVNGSLVAQANVDDGLGFEAWASAQSLENQRLDLEIPDWDSPFRVGDNVIAVAIKQVDSAAADLSFDLRLTALPDVEPTAVPCAQWPPPPVEDDEGCGCEDGSAALLLPLLFLARRRMA